MFNVWYDVDKFDNTLKNYISLPNYHRHAFLANWCECECE